INKATPTITWANPTDISYGTALGSTQLNATATNPNGGATVAGTFTYTPPAGTVLGAGNGQSLSVAFAPTDTANYNGNSKGVSINVNAASTSISNVSGSGTYGGTTSLQATLKDAGGTGVSGKSVSFSLNGNSVG